MDQLPSAKHKGGTSETQPSCPTPISGVPMGPPIALMQLQPQGSADTGPGYSKIRPEPAKWISKTYGHQTHIAQNM